MKQVLVWLLDAVAWILRIVIAPLKFVVKRVWPSAKFGQTGHSQELPPVEAEIKQTVSASNDKPSFILPATEKGKENLIKPAVKIRPGWFALPLETLPHPTYWPVVLALGLIFLVFGVVTSFVFSIVGALMFILGITGWIGDMWNEQSE